MSREITPSAPINEYDRRWRKFYDVTATAGPIVVQSAASTETQPVPQGEQPVEIVDA